MEITDEMWWRMCSCNLSMPYPLEEFDLSTPFIYDRKIGFFYCGQAHPIAMAQLLAFEKGQLYYNDYDKESEEWLAGEGRAYRSSVSSHVKAGKKGNFTYDELKLFGEVDYLLED
jgi:hypothetical protein